MARRRRLGAPSWLMRPHADDACLPPTANLECELRCSPCIMSHVGSVILMASSVSVTNTCIHETWLRLRGNH